MSGGREMTGDGEWRMWNLIRNVLRLQVVNNLDFASGSESGRTKPKPTGRCRSGRKPRLVVVSWSAKQAECLDGLLAFF